MNEDEVISLIRKHIEGFFPKLCGNCGRRFDTLKEYIQTTDIRGSVISHDVSFGDWEPETPLGTVTYANCPCGSTLSLGSAGMALPLLWSLMAWLKIETKKRGLDQEELLNYLRDKICEQVLLE